MYFLWRVVREGACIDVFSGFVLKFLWRMAYWHRGAFSTEPVTLRYFSCKFQSISKIPTFYFFFLRNETEMCVWIMMFSSRMLEINASKETTEVGQQGSYLLFHRVLRKDSERNSVNTGTIPWGRFFVVHSKRRYTSHWKRNWWLVIKLKCPLVRCSYKMVNALYIKCIEFVAG